MTSADGVRWTKRSAGINRTFNDVTAFAPNNNALALKFTPKTGLLSGKFTSPVPARTTTFQGVLLPAFKAIPPQGRGYLLLPGAMPAAPAFSGEVTFKPLVLFS